MLTDKTSPQDQRIASFWDAHKVCAAHLENGELITVPKNDVQYCNSPAYWLNGLTTPAEMRKFVEIGNTAKENAAAKEKLDKMIGNMKTYQMTDADALVQVYKFAA